MAQSRDESAPSRIELVVLACLSQSKPPSDTELGDAVQQLALPKEPPEVARQRAVELLARLVRRAWATSDDEVTRQNGRRKAQGGRTLTESGTRALREAFHVSRTPTWAEVRDMHFPTLGLGLSRNSELAEGCSENAQIGRASCRER